MKTAHASKLLLSLFTLAVLAGCNKSEAPSKPAANAAAPATSYLETIKARDKLIVGVFTDKPPFGFVTRSDPVRMTLGDLGAIAGLKLAQFEGKALGQAEQGEMVLGEVDHFF